MKIDKKHVKTVINALVDAYPESVKNWDEVSAEMAVIYRW